jgi:hypothetical protein
MHPASTGNDKSNRKAVIKIDHANRGILWNGKLFALIFVIVQIKFIAPKIDAAPDKCKLKILGIGEFLLAKRNLIKFVYNLYEESPTTDLNERLSTY